MTAKDARSSFVNQRLAKLFAATEEWQHEANCLGLDPDLFFPSRGGGRGEDRESEVAKAVCRGCVVRTECLDYALSVPERFGVWGGLSAKERSRIRGQRLRDGAA